MHASALPGVLDTPPTLAYGCGRACGEVLGQPLVCRPPTRISSYLASVGSRGGSTAGHRCSRPVWPSVHSVAGRSESPIRKAKQQLSWPGWLILMKGARCARSRPRGDVELCPFLARSMMSKPHRASLSTAKCPSAVMTHTECGRVKRAGDGHSAALSQMPFLSSVAETRRRRFAVQPARASLASSMATERKPSPSNRRSRAARDPAARAVSAQGPEPLTCASSGTSSWSPVRSEREAPLL